MLYNLLLFKFIPFFSIIRFIITKYYRCILIYLACCKFFCPVVKKKLLYFYHLRLLCHCILYYSLPFILFSSFSLSGGKLSFPPTVNFPQIKFGSVSILSLSTKSASQVCAKSNKVASQTRLRQRAAKPGEKRGKSRHGTIE